MPQICLTKDLPVGAIYRTYKSLEEQPGRTDLVVIGKGTRQGMGYVHIERRTDGVQLIEWDFGQQPESVLWVNDTPEGEALSTASLLLKAVVSPGEKTGQGQLIEAVTIPWLEIARLLQKDPSLAFQISPRRWEEIIAGAYKRSGFDEVVLTPSSGDLGRDVIAIKHGLGTVRIIDQVKAYKPGHLVTANDVRALYGVVEADKASKGFLTTTSDFAPRLETDVLLRPLIPSRIELVNGVKLLQRLAELSK